VGEETIAFLVGLGHFEYNQFHLRQYFLNDLKREPALLQAVSAYLARFSAIASFNGKAFDLPLLETRFRLVGLPSIRSFPHMDLLHASRRLYRGRFDSCRLKALEHRVLGLARPTDVPSAEVPALYFRFLATGRFRALAPVFSHNALDVLSLLSLGSHLGRIYSGRARLTCQDALAMGRICEQERRWPEAIARYQSALDSGLPELDKNDAERRLSALFKRLGQWRRAVDLWQQMALRAENRSLFPHLQLALYYERRERDVAAAVRHTELALALLQRHHLRLHALGSDRQEISLRRRLARLQNGQQRERRSVGKRYEKILSLNGSDDTRDVAFPCRVLGEHHRTGAHPSSLASARDDLSLTDERNNELPSGRRVIVHDASRGTGAKDQIYDRDS
jgi:hypothetical protein